MFLLFPCRLVSFPLPSQVPPLRCQAAVLLYKYLISHWPHPVSQMRCSSFCTYTVPYFNPHSWLFLPSSYTVMRLLCGFLVFLLILLFILLVSKKLCLENIQVFRLLLPLLLILKFFCCITIAEISPVD